MIEPTVEPHFRDNIRAWVKGIGPEIGFWSAWMRTRGLKWPEDYARRTEAEPVFSLEPYLDGARPLKALDVGSGPFSPVGLISSWGRIDLQACDPLANFYARLYQEHDVNPYVRTQFAFAEALTDRYERGAFDLVHMSNALDHSILPEAGVLSMLAVTRPGGCVVLRHSENEAVHENYSGFHQWNITEQDGSMVAWRQLERTDLSALASEYAEVSTWRMSEGDDIPEVICTRMLRNENPVPQTNRYKNLFDAELLMELHALSAAAASP